VAARKAAALLACGADVTVVAPEVCEDMRVQPVTIVRRRYRRGEATGYSLVLTATGDADVDRRVFLDAEAAGVPVNAADDPASCSFLMPAVTRIGPVAVAVTTAGVSPWLAGWVRNRVADALPKEVADLADIVGEARAAVRAADVATEGLDWSGLVDELVWPLVRAGDVEAARAAADGWVEGVLA
jgi:siroheme synthase-like protein